MISAMTQTVAKTRSTPKLEVKDPARAPAFLHEFFDEASRRFGNHIAVDTPPTSRRAERRVVRYEELKRQSDALATLLRDFVKGECVVAILLPRDSEHLYLAQIAVLKAGAAYACIDPMFPDEQMRLVLNDSHAVAVLTDRAGAARTRRVQPDIDLTLDVVAWAETVEGPVESPAPAPWLTPESLAYVIYTSGTTGRPKGVMIEHASIANLIRGNLLELGIKPHDRIGQISSSAYDASVEEIWMTFSAGATLVPMDDDTARLGPDMPAWLRREGITVLSPTPTALRSMGCENPQREVPDVRLIYVGGEALPVDVVEKWAPGRKLLNGYGPTECTVTSLRGRVLPGEAIHIGNPMFGVDAWVLDENLQEVSPGTQGELCLGGIMLARGYMNEPEMTARKFPLHPRFGRIYRTGDLVHRTEDGRFFCHGRIDSQVKVRGYRIELEAIESRLSECAGVREAICRVQGDGAQQKIVAFIVPSNPATPPHLDGLCEDLRKVLPEYMVPARIGVLEELPRSVSGKLNRKALPMLEGPNESESQHVAPRNATENTLATAMQRTLKTSAPVSVFADFFHDLGGDSLLAAQLISKLRDDPTTASLTVRDVYESRTIAELAKRVRASTDAGKRTARRSRPAEHPALATLVQVVWLLLGLIVGAPIAYGLAFHLVPWVTTSLGLIPLLLLAPVLAGVGFFAYAGATAAFAVLVKKVLIGRYRPMSAPIWGSFFVRNWIVQSAVHMIPWTMLEGSLFQIAILRALGARIGRRVHIHRGVNLTQGGWDLLDIGDDVTLSQDATIGLVQYEDGQVIIDSVTLGSGCTLDVRAGVAGGAAMEPDSFLTPLSFLPPGGKVPRGARWDGIPAQPAGRAPARAELTESSRELPPVAHAMALAASRGIVALFINLPTVLLMFAFTALTGLEAEGVLEWLFEPAVHIGEVMMALAIVFAHVPLTLTFSVIAMRLLGRVPEGVVSRWSLAYIRVWLKTGILTHANTWLLGSLYWPIWLRLAGMKVGRGCELSSIYDTIPELVEIGDGTFFADGIYLGGPKVHRGRVTLAMVGVGKECFFGNNVMIAAGQTVPDGVLLGISTVADDAQLRPGSSWFGQPPFELPKREIVECDRSLTHTPKWMRFGTRLFWDTMRFALPVVPLLLVFFWVKLLALAEAGDLPFPVILFGVVPALDFGLFAGLCVFGWALKWLLLGRVKPGVHPLWSSWCSRWEYHYVAWELYTAGTLSLLEGTVMLNWILRATGMKIGKGVFLGHGVASWIDHDMLEFEDGATLTCMFQAHTFEDRVLKIDRVKVRKNATIGVMAVVLYGADIGESTEVVPHSVVMKHEKLLPRRRYIGAPTHAVS